MLSNMYPESMIHQKSSSFSKVNKRKVDVKLNYTRLSFKIRPFQGAM